jgi:hypothetical protein
MSWRRANSANAAISDGGIVTPLGFPGVINTTARVRGVISAEASAARDEIGVRLEVQRLDAAHPQPRVVVEVVGQRSDHLVAGAGERAGGQAERVVAPRGDDHVGWLDGARVVARQLVRDSSTQRGERETGHRRVHGAVGGLRDLDNALDDLGAGG